MVSISVVSNNYRLEVDGEIAIVFADVKWWNSMTRQQQVNFCKDICEKHGVNIIGIRENTDEIVVPLNIYHNDYRGGYFVK